MKIQKINHSCLVVEEEGVKILFDPGVFSKEAADLTGLHYIIITHEHSDHCDIPIIKIIIKNNPEAIIITNSSVGRILDKETIAYEVVDDGKTYDLSGVSLKAFGKDHAFIHKSVPSVENTGYLVAEKFYHPGDAYHVPSKAVEILALPLSAPWGTIGASINYALDVKPKKCFSIHDGMLKFRGPYDFLPKQILAEEGIQYLEPRDVINLEV